MVWNPEKGHAESVRLGTDSGLDIRYGHATVDAPPEIMALWEQQKAEAEKRRLAFEEAECTRRLQEAEARRRKEAEAAAKEPKVGRIVKVVGGRTNPMEHGRDSFNWGRPPV